MKHLLSLLLFALIASHAAAQTPRTTVRLERVEDLAADVRSQGDAARGAIAFHQATLACAKCHTVDGSGLSLGPDLAKLGREVTVEQLIESVLSPSNTIRPGFAPITVQTTDGRTIVGLLVEELPEALVIREAAIDGKRITLRKSDVDERHAGTISLMPADVADQLTDRQQFLDLIRYLSEIAAGGIERARLLQPTPDKLVIQVPEYERTIDHAGMIAALDKKAYKRGQEIYENLCRNCHGTKTEPGSLPTSLRFASGKFKNGSDPWKMYQSLTYGFGLMAPQAWMVPQQKYDVIHYIREDYLKRANPSQFFDVTKPYLAGLPKGTSRGPAPVKYEPWAKMDYGPALTATYEVGDKGSNFAYKGTAVRLDVGIGGVAAGQDWMLFDHDTLRMAAAWSGRGFIDFHGINFDGRHNAHPRLVGDVLAGVYSGVGWANPADGSFDDVRIEGRDGRRYGPLPRAWGKYHGYYQHGDRPIFSYSIGETPVLESPGMIGDKEPAFTRTFRLGPRKQPLTLVVAQQEPDGGPILSSLAADANASLVGFGKPPLTAGVSPAPPGIAWAIAPAGRLVLKLPAGSEPLSFTVAFSRGDNGNVGLALAAEPADLEQLTEPGPRRWPQVVKTTAVRGTDEGPFAIDRLTLPVVNPWACQMRTTGFDFFADGDRAAVCTWDGDVWQVSGLGMLASATCELQWQRIASGLFQPLGVRIVGEQIFVSCRDQIVALRDRNGDGETDFYECFNDDHQVTDHFHEFAMGLQTDAAGNFYYAKSARHALPAVVPQHGTLLRVSPDGQKTDILANGFRAANGVCVNGDGTFVVSDQEGHWNPKNRINWVQPGGFYGNMFGYHSVTDESDQAMEQPLCWITNEFDRSPGELLWTPKDCWGPLGGLLLNLSYGYGKIYVVPHESVEGRASHATKQGGMCALPIALPTGLIRGRFHPFDKQLYTCGLAAWATSVTQPGGFYRIRATSKPSYLPTELHARPNTVSITFSDPLDAKTADVGRFKVRVWSLKRTANYGSPHVDEHPLTVAHATLSADRRTVVLDLPELQPTWCMAIDCAVFGTDGQRVDRLIHNTIHALAE